MSECQGKVLRLLEKKDGWLGAQEIALFTKLPPVHVRRALSQMLKYNEVFKKEIFIRGKGWRNLWRNKK